MKSFASFRYYYFYFAWKCEAGSCQLKTDNNPTGFAYKVPLHIL